ncbi:MAG: translocation/assembly module TamB domain-containing protein [Acidobacteriota bacterium]
MSAARPFSFQEPPPEPENTPKPRHRWGRILGWIGGAIAILLVLIVVSIAIVIHTTAFHNWVLAKVRSSASTSLGVRVDLQNFALHFSPLGLDIYGLTVAGANPYPAPPLLQVQHAEVGLRIVSILHKKWYLSSIRIDHPVAQVYVDKNGVSNIPKLKSSGSSKSSINLFDLGVRHAVLDQGAILYNDRKVTLDANLENVEFNAGYKLAQTMYTGTLQYTNGRIVYDGYRPLEHNFAANFSYTPTTFQLNRAEIASPAAKIYLTASVTHLNAPVVQANYQVTLDGANVAALMRNPSVPAGTIRLSGNVHYQQTPNVPALDSVRLDGDLASPGLLVHTTSLRTAIHNIAAHYSVANGNAALRDFHASLLGGEITAQASIQQLTGNTHSEMTANVRNISLADATHTFAPHAAPTVAVTGALNAAVKASWGKTIKDMVAHADATVHGQVRSRQTQPGVINASTATAASAPLDSEIHADYSGVRQQATLTNTYLRTTQTTLTMNGTVSRSSSLAIRLQANDLHELATLADLFRGPAATPLDLGGRATFQGTVQGATSAPHIHGQLNASNLHFNGTDWKVFRAGLDAGPNHASLTNAELDPEPKGHITLSASTGLKKWKFTNTSPLQVNLNAAQLDIAQLQKLASKQVPISGTLSTHLSLHGTELNPEGSGNLSISKLNAYNQPINSVQVTFRGNGDNAIAKLDVSLAAGSLHGNVSVQPKEKTYTAQLDTTGIQLDKLEALKARNMDLTGVLMLHASGQGSFSNPQVNASVQIPTLTVQKQAVKDIHLNLALADHVANATLSSTAVNTSIQAKARVNLTGDYQTDATLDTQNIPLQPIVAMYSPAQAASLSGDTELHATVHGPLKSKQLLQAQVTIPYLKVGYGNTIQLASAGPIRADYRDGIVNLQHSAIRGTDTDLDFQGSIPVGVKGPMSLMLHGNVNLQIAQLFNPDVRTSGQIRFNINSNNVSAGKLGGEIDVVDASYASGSMPVGLQHGNGVLTLTTDRVDIKSFEGTVGGGKVTASGGVAYRPALRFDLGLAAKGIRMLYPQGMREDIHANVHLAGTTENAILGGTVNLANISFTPAFDLTSFASQFSSGVAGPPPMGITQNIKLNLAVHSTNNVALMSQTLSLDGSANLQVRGTVAQPVILGRVTLTGGDVIMHNDRFVLEGATIQFVNPSQTQPVINATITTTIQQYNLGLHFQGPADQMRTQYTSDPALPQADIINLLAFGQTTEASANQPATPPTQEAESLVASQVTNQITSRIAKVAGISQLSISPVLGNAPNQGAGADITVQQRVTGNLFVTFSDNTADPQSEVIQGQYKVSPRVSLSATRDPNGGFAVDTLIKKTW